VARGVPGIKYHSQMKARFSASLLKRAGAMSRLCRAGALQLLHRALTSAVATSPRHVRCLPPASSRSGSGSLASSSDSVPSVHPGAHHYASSSSPASDEHALTGDAAGGAADGDAEAWETVVGLELHVQVAANTKLFSGYVARVLRGGCRVHGARYRVLRV